MKKNVLLFFPNVANWAAIATSVPILGGIANRRKWNVDYIDTFRYQKGTDASMDKETSGGFKPGLTKMAISTLPTEKLVLDLQSRIDMFKPDVLAITAMSHEFQYLISFFPNLRIPDQTIVVIGGIHSTLRPDEVIETGLFDLVCIGQGEQVFDDILSRIEGGENLQNIEGTCFRDRKTANIKQNGKRKLIEPEHLWETETLYSFFDDQYFCYPFDGRILRRLWLEVARGCPYNCAYCGNSALKKVYKGLGKYVCTRPMDSTFRHLKKMVQEYKIGIFYLGDECFLAHQTSYLKEFAKRYSTEVHKPFLVQSRPETITEEKINILRSFGAPFFQVSIGVESGSEKILKDVCNRNTKIDDIVRAFDLLHKYNIRSAAYFMVGFPFETREDIFKTIELCRRINPSVASVNIFQPLPGQKLTDVCIEHGFITGKETLVTFTETSILRMPQISPEEISGLRRTFMLYAKLPKKYYPDIEKCEEDYENNKQLFDELVKLRWEIEDS